MNPHRQNIVKLQTIAASQITRVLDPVHTKSPLAHRTDTSLREGRPVYAVTLTREQVFRDIERAESFLDFFGIHYVRTFMGQLFAQGELADGVPVAFVFGDYDRLPTPNTTCDWQVFFTYVGGRTGYRILGMCPISEAFQFTLSAHPVELRRYEPASAVRELDEHCRKVINERNDLQAKIDELEGEVNELEEEVDGLEEQKHRLVSTVNSLLGDAGARSKLLANAQAEVARLKEELIRCRAADVMGHDREKEIPAGQLSLLTVKGETLSEILRSRRAATEDRSEHIRRAAELRRQLDAEIILHNTAKRQLDRYVEEESKLRAENTRLTALADQLRSQAGAWEQVWFAIVNSPVFDRSRYGAMCGRDTASSFINDITKEVAELREWKQGALKQLGKLNLQDLAWQLELAIGDDIALRAPTRISELRQLCVDLQVVIKQNNHGFLGDDVARVLTRLKEKFPRLFVSWLS